MVTDSSKGYLSGAQGMSCYEGQGFARIDSKGVEHMQASARMGGMNCLVLRAV